MARAIEIFAAINFLVMGASHVLAPQAWKEFFTLLHSKGAAGNFLNAFLALGMGSFVVAFHPGFDGVVPSLLTAYGWVSIVKGSLFLIVPRIGVESIARPTRTDAKLFVIPGVILIAFGAALLLYPVI